MNRRTPLCAKAVTRFAPSPTGYLHLGHAFAALEAVRGVGPAGTVLLRIEDLDTTRARAGFEAAIFEDLAWLGLSWPEPVMRQSERGEAYGAALARLRRLGLTYPCFCTRKEIQEEIAHAVSAPHGPAEGPDGPLYPGTCRRLSADEREQRLQSGAAYAVRLDLAAALAHIKDKGPLRFQEKGRGPAGEHGTLEAHPELFGDIVLRRKDAPASYHLAVVVDDAAQGVSLVSRGEDLFAATHIQRLLQDLLDLPAPEYRHHGLVTDEAGRRLAKRDDARSLRALRDEGWSPQDVRRHLAPWRVLPGVEAHKDLEA